MTLMILKPGVPGFFPSLSFMNVCVGVYAPEAINKQWRDLYSIRLVENLWLLFGSILWLLPQCRQ